MKETTFLFSILFSILATSNAFHRLVPPEKELIYNYETSMTAATWANPEAVSAMYLKGKIHIQRNDKDLYVKFSDVTTKSCKGNIHELEKHLKETPLRQEASELHNPFKITYDDNTDLVESYQIPENEKKFVKNIKKTLANILQLNVKLKDQKTFVDHEPSIYGLQETKYNVVPFEKNTYKVEKFTKLPLKYFQDHFYSTTLPNKCLPEDNYGLSMNIAKTYTVKKDESQLIVKKIEVENILNYMPFNFNGDTTRINGSVKMTLETINPIESKLSVADNTPIDKDLTVMDNHGFNFALGIYKNAQNVDMEKLKTNVLRMLKEAVAYMEKRHLKETDLKKSQLIRRIIRSMEHFDNKMFDEMWKELKDKMDIPLGKLYINLLPFVGTSASLEEIKDLIINKEVDRRTAVMLLQKHPHNIKEFSADTISIIQELFVKAQEVYKDDNYVEQAIILSYGAAVGKMRKYASFSNQLKEIAEKKIHEDIDITKKMAYMGALYNAGGVEARKNFDNLMKGDETLRFMTLWGTKESIPSNETYEKYWPVITNKTELVTTKAIAIYYIIKSSQDFSVLEALQSHMLKEEDMNLYQFYYRTLQSTANGRSHCESIKRKWAKQLLNVLDEPINHGLNGNYIDGFRDYKFDLEKIEEYLYITDETSAFFKFSINKNLLGLNNRPLTAFMRITGLTPALKKILLEVRKDHKNFIDFSGLKDLANENVQVELYNFAMNQVTSVRVFKLNDEKRFKEVIDMFTFQESESDLLGIHNFEVMHYIPMETGMIAMLEMFFPKITYGSSKLAKIPSEDNFKVSINYNHKTWSNGQFGLKFYNSIDDKFQGIARYHSIDNQVPLKLEITTSTDPVATLRVVFTNPEDDKDAMLFKTRVKFETYAEGSNMISTHPGDHDDETEDDENHHYAYAYDRMDTESDVDVFINLIKEYFSTKKDQFWPEIYNQVDIDKRQPKANSMGIHKKIYMGGSSGISKYEFIFTGDHKMVKDRNPLTPEMVMHLNMTFNNYDRENKVKLSLDVDGTYHINAGHDDFFWKILIGRRMSGHERGKLCLEGHKSWGNHEVNGSLTLYDAEGPLEQICNPEYKVLEVTMHGSKTDESDFDSCRDMRYNRLNDKYLNCFMSKDAIRSYDYHWKWHKEHKEFQSVAKNLGEMFSASYFNYIQTWADIHVINETDDKNKINVMFFNDDNKMQLWFKSETLEKVFTNVDEKHGNFWFYKPDTPHFPSMYKKLKKLGWLTQCTVTNSKIHHRTYSVDNQLSTEWTLVSGDAENDPKLAIFVKKLEGSDNMAVKFVQDDSELIIKLVNGEFTIENNGSELIKHTIVEPRYGEDYIYVNSEYLGTFAFFDGKTLHLDMVNTNLKKFGKCYSK